MPTETYLSDAALAARFGVSRSSIWRWARLTDFPRPVALAPGTTRWRESDIAAWEAAKAADGGEAA